jgi:hypothetical protein
MDINYKILCEVKLLHEYYLTDKDGSTIFDKPVQADRLNFLRDRFRFNYPSINEHLEYAPAAPFRLEMENSKIRIIQSYSGFKVFISVKEQMLPGNIKAYRPLQELTGDQPIVIQLRNKDAVIDSLSNNGVKRTIPGRYYFTNRSLGGVQESPMLSRALTLKDDAPQQEQGELVFDPGDNKVKALFFKKDGTKDWLEVKGSGYASANDLILVSRRFYYSFYPADAVTDATFVLKDSTSAAVFTINRTDTDPFKKVELDYSTVIPALLDVSGGSHTSLYTLEVNGSGGYQRTYSLLFCPPALTQSDTWGLVHLQPRVADPLYDLLDDDGLLKTRKHPDGTIDLAPVFEVRIKSRFAFWRYRNTKNEKILDNVALHPFLSYDAANGFMETNKMLNASYTPIEFSNMGTTQYLPNPDADSPLNSELQRVYTDIRVPKSDLFKI